ncbi:hypothetical protein ACFE04_027311 [Oxalis oulophora]
MKKQFNRKKKQQQQQQRGFKRKYEQIEHQQTLDDDDDDTTSSETSQKSEEEVEEEEEVIIFKDPSHYDNLLKTLGDANKKMRQAKESSSDSEQEQEQEQEEESDGSDSLSGSDVEDKDEQEIHDQDPTNHEFEKDDATDSEASDTDVEQDSDIKDRAKKSSNHKSNFEKRFEYKLSKEEAENLLKNKLTYKWEVPDVDDSHCKWMGTGSCFLKDDTANSNYGLKPKLYKHLLDVCKTSDSSDFLSSKQKWFLSLFSSYRDILHGNKKPFYLKGVEEDSAVMEAYLTHSLNHIFKTRDLVKKNNSKIAKNREGALTDDGFLDQGFTRPKVLILLPLRRIAFRVVKRLIQLTPDDYKTSVEHLGRFYDDFGNQVDEETMDENVISSSQISSKPHDFQALFGDNRTNEDNFMMGIKFTRKSIRLFSHFHSSDMIIASPVKLLDEIQRVQENKELDVDYLSSIEVLVTDHADVISMQNWSYFTSVVEKVNSLPTKQHGTDVMRIKSCYLDGQARFFRQTIVLSSFLNPDPWNSKLDLLLSPREERVLSRGEDDSEYAPGRVPQHDMHSAFLSLRSAEGNNISRDHYPLERIAGSTMAKKLIKSEKDVFVFC